LPAHRSTTKKFIIYPGAECGKGCDHVTLVVVMKVKVKKTKKNMQIRKDCNILRRDEEVGERYAVEVENNSI
jgi:hypothetical protein